MFFLSCPCTFLVITLWLGNIFTYLVLNFLFIFFFFHNFSRINFTLTCLKFMHSIFTLWHFPEFVKINAYFYLPPMIFELTQLCLLTFSSLWAPGSPHWLVLSTVLFSSWFLQLYFLFVHLQEQTLLSD